MRVLVQVRSLITTGSDGLSPAHPTIALDEMVRRVGHPSDTRAGWLELTRLGLATTLDGQSYTLTPIGVMEALRTPADVSRQQAALRPRLHP